MNEWFQKGKKVEINGISEKNEDLPMRRHSSITMYEFLIVEELHCFGIRKANSFFENKICFEYSTICSKHQRVCLVSGPFP
jgi:hypothetical protein